MTYLIRLDDVCETMDWGKWLKIKALFDKYGIKPLIAVIPNNEDPLQKICPPNENFWKWLKMVELKGWEIGLHGYNHVYQTNQGGINPIHKRSEFAGVPLQQQKDKIKKGINKLNEMGFYPKIFVAPSHTFDLHTLEALKSESTIRIISDTMALNPYKFYDFVFIPQQIGSVRNIHLPGVYTFCYHPNSMNDSSFLDLENFLIKNSNKFLSFSQINVENLRPKTIIDNLLSFVYFKFRSLFR
jgi:predicted deacetylase